jgi:hypothetical protein
VYHDYGGKERMGALAIPGAISLLEMLERGAHRFVAIGVYLEKVATFLGTPNPAAEIANCPKESPPRTSAELSARLAELDAERESRRVDWGAAQRAVLDELFGQLPPLREDCLALGLKCSVAQIDRMIGPRVEHDPNAISEQLSELLSRIHDELQGQVFYALDFGDCDFYLSPLKNWERVVARFPEARSDIEEAGKCFAFERYSACIFHLMRVTEAGVTSLAKLVNPNDFKPQFSSVLKRIDELVIKTKWPDWPTEARAHKQLFVDVLPRLYAVKDSWRDRAAHFDSHVVPIDPVSNRERARDIYNCTLSLMRILAERLTGAVQV